MKIFVDMDGVLADFYGRLAMLYNCKVEDMVIPGEYNPMKKFGKPNEDLWEVVNRDRENFFAELEPYPWVESLLGLCEDAVGEENVAILTSPAKGVGQAVECVSGKVRWIYRHIPRYYKRFFIGSEKEMVASPTSLLIDDSDLKIKRWKNAGGTGCLFPQLWNSNHKIRHDRMDLTKCSVSVFKALKGVSV